jgi:hypothetical protein
MSKSSGWVPIDKGLVKYLPKIDRPYSPLEAMFSYTVDINCGRRWSINGYAELWKWNRKKVARFIKECGTDTGHIPDKKGTQTGQAIHFIDEGLWGERDNNGTSTGQERDRNGDTTINPNPNPNIILKDKTFFIFSEEDLKFYREAFPNIAVDEQIKKMSSWCYSNPSKRKTKRGIKKFINNWLSGVKPEGLNPQQAKIEKLRNA